MIDVHDLHSWTLTSEMDVATVHLMTREGTDPTPSLIRRGTSLRLDTTSHAPRSKSSWRTTSGVQNSPGSGPNARTPAAAHAVHPVVISPGRCDRSAAAFQCATIASKNGTWRALRDLDCWSWLAAASRALDPWTLGSHSESTCHGHKNRGHMGTGTDSSPRARPGLVPLLADLTS